MQNIGEELAGEYLRYFEKCDFITYNTINPLIQGEIDVIGMNLKTKTVFYCEVAIHTGGLNYVTNKRPDNYNRFKSKFDKIIDYHKNFFNEYKIQLMLWSPIVKNSPNAKYNAFAEIQKLKNTYQNLGYDMDLIVNQSYLDCMKKLKSKAGELTACLDSSVMRLFQIQEYTERYVQKIN